MDYEQIPVEEYNAWDNGAPSFLSHNVLKNLVTSSFPGNMTAAGVWSTSPSAATVVNSGAGNADPSYPVRRAYDGHAYLGTQSTSSATTQYLIFAPTPLATELGHVDTIAIHLLGDVSGGVSMSVHVTDDSDPTFSSAILFGSFLSVTQTGWLVVMSSSRFSEVGLIRITITGTATYEIGEVVAGRRRQMGHPPMEAGHDPHRVRSSIDRFVSETGTVSTYVYNKGQCYFNENFQVGGMTGPDSVDALTKWFRDCDYGTKPFLYIDEPNATPPRGHWCLLDDPALEIPHRSVFERQCTLEFYELAPFQSSSEDVYISSFTPGAPVPVDPTTVEDQVLNPILVAPFTSSGLTTSSYGGTYGYLGAAFYAPHAIDANRLYFGATVFGAGDRMRFVIYQHADGKLYDSEEGVPLLVEAEIQGGTTGIIELTIPTASIVPGFYWLVVTRAAGTEAVTFNTYTTPTTDSALGVYGAPAARSAGVVPIIFQADTQAAPATLDPLGAATTPALMNRVIAHSLKAV